MPSAARWSRAIRVALISDHPIVRAGVRSLLAPYADRVLVAEDGTDLAEVEVVLYDVLGLSHGDTELEKALKAHPDRVLALSRELQPGLGARALVMGAAAVVPIGVDAADLVAAVESFAAGHLQDGSQADLDNQADLRRQLGRDANLSPRELDVLGLIVRGRSNEEVAAELYLSINSVKSYIRAAYAKIGVTSRTQAVAWGVEHGFPTADIIEG